MFDPCERGDSKAGFYYDLKILAGLLYMVFVASVAFMSLLGF